MNKRLLAFVPLVLALASASAQKPRTGDPALTELWTPEPRIVTPGKTQTDAPSDAIVLFNGSNLSAWHAKNDQPIKWDLANGAMTVRPDASEIFTNDNFGDCQLHIEWRTPAEAKGEGQGRGNSGIFFMGKYELQILDSYKNKTYVNGQAGSVYKQWAPLVNASRGPGEWQSFDILFTAPLFYEDGSVKSPARITVFHNGVLIQNNAVIAGTTHYIGAPAYEKHADKLPLGLQGHGDPVSFRNIWIRRL